jgi:hypothetical protein
MRYILLAGSVIFGIAGLSQAMDAIRSDGLNGLTVVPHVIDLQFLTVSFTPLPGFVRILILSIGLFVMYLVRRKLKKLGMGKLTEYIME